MKRIIISLLFIVILMIGCSQETLLSSEKLPTSSRELTLNYIKFEFEDGYSPYQNCMIGREDRYVDVIFEDNYASLRLYSSYQHYENAPSEVTIELVEEYAQRHNKKYYGVTAEIKSLEAASFAGLDGVHVVSQYISKQREFRREEYWVDYQGDIFHYVLELPVEAYQKQQEYYDSFASAARINPVYNTAQSTQGYDWEQYYGPVDYRIAKYGYQFDPIFGRRQVDGVIVGLPDMDKLQEESLVPITVQDNNGWSWMLYLPADDYAQTNILTDGSAISAYGHASHSFNQQFDLDSIGKVEMTEYQLLNIPYDNTLIMLPYRLICAGELLNLHDTDTGRFLYEDYESADLGEPLPLLGYPWESIYQNPANYSWALGKADRLPEDGMMRVDGVLLEGLEADTRLLQISFRLEDTEGNLWNLVMPEGTALQPGDQVSCFGIASNIADDKRDYELDEDSPELEVLRIVHERESLIVVSKSRIDEYEWAILPEERYPLPQFGQFQIGTGILSFGMHREEVEHLLGEGEAMTTYSARYFTAYQKYDDLEIILGYQGDNLCYLSCYSTSSFESGQKSLWMNWPGDGDADHFATVLPDAVYSGDVVDLYYDADFQPLPGNSQDCAYVLRFELMLGEYIRSVTFMDAKISKQM